MRLASRKLKWFALVLIILGGAFVAARRWLVPAVISSQIQARYRGKVEIGDWWLGWNSSGIRGIKLYETMQGDTPPWFSAEEVSTDVSLSRLIRGNVLPTRVEVERAAVALRFDSKGQLATKIPVVDPAQATGQAQKPGPPLPEILAHDAKITLAQEGRAPMPIAGVEARLIPVADGSRLEVKTDDPTWGRVTVQGHFNPTFKVGQVELATGPGFRADPKRLAEIPFIPSEVWSNIQPRGPVEAKVKIVLDLDSKKPISVHTEIGLLGAQAQLKPLQIEATDATGRVMIDDAFVKLEGFQGKTVDGTIEAKGTLDFAPKVPVFDLDVRLKGVDVTKAPAAWQLGEVGATGRLSGRVELKVALEPGGPDLTGTAGRAVIEDGSFQGIPIKSLDLGLRADGGDLQYQALPAGSVDKDHLEGPLSPLPDNPAPNRKALAAGRRPGPGQIELPDPVLEALPLIDLASHKQGFLGWAAFLAKEAVAYQVQHATKSHGGGLRLPKTISTRIELEDVELNTLVAKAKKFGFTIPVPIGGRFSITADATIPLGSLRDFAAYKFKGDATLRGASIDHVDLGLVTGHVVLEDGRLDVTDFRGQFVDKPTGGNANLPQATPNVASAGPLPPGGFRARIHAQVSPPGVTTAHFEGDKLPLGELFAPFLPQPTPLSGEATVRVDARADLGQVADPNNWEVSGTVDSRMIRYLQAELDEVSTKVIVHAGRVDVPTLTAFLMGRPLRARGRVAIAPPHHFDGGITIEGWEIAEVLKLVPTLPGPAISGKLDAKGEATGSVVPFGLTTRGAARVLNARAGPAPVGNLGFQWKTDRDQVAVEGLELYAFGGKTTGSASIPIHPGKSITASAVMVGIDSSRFSDAFLGKTVTLAGRADGRISVRISPDTSTVDGIADLRSPTLVVRENGSEGVAVKSLLVQGSARNGVFGYEATAESLGGKLRFRGSAPIVADLSKVVADGEVSAVGFHLGELWRGMGLAGGMSHLDGVGAFDANLRAPLQPFQLVGRGLFEFRDLRYGSMPPLGNLKGVAAIGPNSWQVEDLKGELLGGLASGEARGEMLSNGLKSVTFDFRVDRASLARLAKASPILLKGAEGFGSLRVSGRLAEALRANAEMLVPRANVLGLAISDLRLPMDVELNPASGTGSIHSRSWNARVAGGSIRGNASRRIGSDRSFQADFQLSGVDLEALAKLHPSGKKPPTGKVSGKISLSGPSTDHLEKVRGRVDLDLDDASLVEVPMFKELDRMLGSSGGGLFDDGDVHGTIANKTLYLEQLTLTGRLVQIHATGSVGFNGALNLEVLINTDSTISQPELALLNLLPGVGVALNRGEEALRRVANVLENSLLRFRVTGTTSNPRVQLDAGVAVGGAAVGFFSSVIKIPGR